MKNKTLQKLKYTLDQAQKASDMYFDVTSILPCSVTEAKERKDLAGLKFDLIDKTIANKVYWENELSKILQLPQLMEINQSWKLYHLARNSLRMGRIVTISS